MKGKILARNPRGYDLRPGAIECLVCIIQLLQVILEYIFSNILVDDLSSKCNKGESIGPSPQKNPT